MGDRFILNDHWKKQPFTVPENYFEQFVVNKHVALSNELKQNPYAVPENYFDKLSVCLAEKMIAAKVQPAILHRQSLRSQLAFAASFVLLVGMGFGLVSLLQPSAANNPVETIVESFPAYFTDRVDEHTLLQVATGEVKTTAEISNDDIIQYLTSTNISLNDIAALY